MKSLVSQLLPERSARVSLSVDDYQIIEAGGATPVVCVGLATYNQEAFIAQAIDGILSQKTSFPVRLVISDDGSTDKTADICRAYQHKYPDRIELLLAHRNTNFGICWVLHSRSGKCGAKYIAECEGDDYWTDPLKLQKQVEFLEAHPSCSMVFTAAVEDRSGSRIVFRPDRIQEVYPSASLLSENYIRNCTVLYRNVMKGEYPDWLSQMPVGDWPLHILHSLHGDIGYIDEPTAVYRIHGGGIWASRSPVVNSRATIKTCRMLIEYLPAEVPRQPLKDYIVVVHREIVYYCMVWGNTPHRGWRSLLALLMKGHRPFLTFKDLVRAMVWVICPPLGRKLRKMMSRDRETIR